MLSEQLFIRGKHEAEPTGAAHHLKLAAEQMSRWAAEFCRLALSCPTWRIGGAISLVCLLA